MNLPLLNKKILITRTAEQSLKFSKQIIELGGEPIVFPLIKLIPINVEVLTQTLIQNNFDWIIFTSPQAVNFYFEKNEIPKNNIQIAVVGNGTQKALNDLGVQVDFIPSQYTAKQLAIEIPIVEDQYVFIPRSDKAKDDIVEILEQRNCKVKTLSIYQNIAVNYSKKQVEELNSKTIDFITFTSGSTVQSFKDNGLVVSNQKTVCIGPETALVAGKLNVQVDAVANPHNIKGMLDEMVNRA